MKLTNGFSVYKFIIYWTIVLLGIVCIGCSSKHDEEKQDNAVPPPTASKEQGQISSKEEEKQPKRKSDRLKRIPARAAYRKEQIVSDSNKYIKDENKAAAIIAELDSATGPERKIELIESLGKLSLEQDLSVIDVVRKALDDPNPEVQHAAIELLEDYQIPEVLPVIAQALKSPDEQTREYALRPLSHINDPKVGQLLAQALDDASEDVRSAAIETSEDCQEHIKLGVMEKAITSPYDDVKEAVVSMLEDRGDRKAVEILIIGLKNSDANSRQLINEALDFLIEKEFETYQEAQSWWLANKDKYDDDLFKIEDQ